MIFLKYRIPLLFVFFPSYVFSCIVCGGAYVYTGAHALCACACGGPRLMLGISLIMFSPYSLRQHLSQARSQTVRLVSLASLLWGSSCLLGSQAFIWVLRIQIAILLIVWQVLFPLSHLASTPFAFYNSFGRVWTSWLTEWVLFPTSDYFPRFDSKSS